MMKFLGITSLLVLTLPAYATENTIDPTHCTQTVISVGNGIELDCSGLGATGISGLQDYPNLLAIDLSNNAIQSVDVSNNPRLSMINLSNNQLDDISSLLTLDELQGVNLAGNAMVPCQALDTLEQQVQGAVVRPAACQ